MGDFDDELCRCFRHMFGVEGGISRLTSWVREVSKLLLLVLIVCNQADTDYGRV